MAIIFAIPGLQVEIVSNGKSCAEFDVVDGDGDGTPAPQGNEVAVKYAQVKEGSNFKVQVHIGKNYPHHNRDLLVAITVGGVQVRDAIFSRGKDFHRYQSRTLVMDKTSPEIINGQNAMRRFKFHSTVPGKFYYFLAFNHYRK
jgi:hypothetical protein